MILTKRAHIADNRQPQSSSSAHARQASKIHVCHICQVLSSVSSRAEKEPFRLIQRPLKLHTNISSLHLKNAAMLYFLYPSALHRYLRDHHGRKSWALVIGASNGIGEGFAYELCSHGFNVVLHGRHVEKLTRIQEALRAEYPKSKVRIVVADAASLLPPQPLMISSQVCKISV